MVRRLLPEPPLAVVLAGGDDRIAIFARDPEGIAWRQPDRLPRTQRGKACALVLPPGWLTLRGIAVPGGRIGEARAAAVLELHSSLAVDPATGWTFVRAGRHGDGFQAVAAFLDNDTLSHFADAAVAAGLAPSRIVVPEFACGASPMVLVSVDRTHALAAYLAGGRPVLWQAFAEAGPSLACCLDLITEQLAAKRLALPERGLVWTMDGQLAGPLTATVGQAFPGIPVECVANWPAVLPRLLDSPGASSTAWMPGRRDVVFGEFLTARDRVRLDGPGLKRLGLAVAAMVVGLMALAFALLRDSEKDLAQLETEVRSLTVQANRSKILGERIRGLSQGIAFIRSHTEDKPMMLGVVATVFRAVPRLLKLDGISVSDQGAVRLNGQAENEFYVTEFLDSLSKLEAVRSPKLESLEVDPKTKTARFAISTTAPAWQKYQEALRAAAQRQQRKKGQP
ncbi:hypothetical protein [Solidesulfovibrio carbinoliphilus]|uniref:hypothetical protein n=1 Tax=Solidesulfovibrio carbinoliphilus TaxID=345370 RepID=UPI0012F4BCB7|nr:hypothetical protein [Solidesulfovibrio carbinoliphilus]